MAFDPALLALFAELRGGSLITLKRDGRPQASVVIHVWDPDRRAVRISVTDDRAKTRNLRRDPRASYQVVVPGPDRVGRRRGLRRADPARGGPARRHRRGARRPLPQAGRRAPGLGGVPGGDGRRPAGRADARRSSASTAASGSADPPTAAEPRSRAARRGDAGSPLCRTARRARSGSAHRGRVEHAPSPRRASPPPAAPRPGPSSADHAHRTPSVSPARPRAGAGTRAGAARACRPHAPRRCPPARRARVGAVEHAWCARAAARRRRRRAGRRRSGRRAARAGRARRSPARSPRRPAASDDPQRRLQRRPVAHHRRLRRPVQPPARPDLQLDRPPRRRVGRGTRLHERRPRAVHGEPCRRGRRRRTARGRRRRAGRPRRGRGARARRRSGRAQHHRPAVRPPECLPTRGTRRRSAAWPPGSRPSRAPAVTPAGPTSAGDPLRDRPRVRLLPQRHQHRRPVLAQPLGVACASPRGRRRPAGPGPSC